MYKNDESIEANNVEAESMEKKSQKLIRGIDWEEVESCQKSIQILTYMYG